MEQTTNPPLKRPYQAPRLLVYGDLRDMTKTGGKGKSDRGGSLKHLT